MADPVSGGVLLGSRRRPLRLSFLGGEPLLAFGLIVRAVHRVTRRQGLRRRVRLGLTTNGLLLTEPRVAFLERHRFDVQISADGVAPAQDLRARGSFEPLDRLIDRLKTRHRGFFRRRVSFAMTVSAPAIPHLADSFEYLLEKGARNIAISAAMGQPRLSAEQAKALVRQFRRIRIRALKHYRATGEVPLMNLRKSAPDPRRPVESDWACAAPSGRDLVVDVDGEVVPCALLIHACQRAIDPAVESRLKAMGLGPVTKPEVLALGLRSLPASAAAAGMFGPQARKRSGRARCATCRFAGACLVCPISCAWNPDSADPNRIPDFQCAFNRTDLAHRRRFPCQP